MAHVLHATEEYFGKLWEVYTPAIFICNLISSKPETGFFIINAIYIIISLGYWRSMQGNGSSHYSMIWPFIVLQTINGTGHIVWTIAENAYTPGVVTAFLILFLVACLVRRLLYISTKQAK